MSIRQEQLRTALHQDLAKVTSNRPHVLVACSQLEESLFKKFSPGEVTDLQAAAALVKFTKANAACADSVKFHTLMPKLRSRIWSILGDDREIITEYNQHYEFGNGKSVKVRYTDMYGKLFGEKLYYSHRAQLSVYRATLSEPMQLAFNEALAAHGLPEETTGKIAFVPKNVDTARVISVEPVLAMLLQQSIKRVMNRRLLGAGIIHTDRKHRSCTSLGERFPNLQQEKNRRFARFGSFNGTFGTIDLSSASDSVSVALCSYLLPSRWFSALWAARTPSVVLPDGSTLPLLMMSTMGNATTFPLQTLIFAAICETVYAELGLLRKKGLAKRYCVNGDDIIVSRDSYDMVVDLLQHCGFSVNAEKSFNRGLFRESCGGDYFSGYPVRGVYIKSLEDDAAIYSAYNRLNVWSRLHSVRLNHTLDLLRGMASCDLVVPIGSDVNSGFWGLRHEARRLRTTRISNSAGAVLKYRRLSAKQPHNGHKYPNPLWGHGMCLERCRHIHW